MKCTKFLVLITALTVYSILLASPNFIIVGIPGSGKGTFSQYLVEHYGYHQVSIGDLIRNHIRNETEFGKQIKEIVKKGEYIDDTITVQLMAQKIKEFNALHVPFIIDGFPRNQYCLDHLKILLHTLNLNNTMHCVNIDAPNSICAQRIAKRLVCLNCAKVNSVEQFGDTESMQCSCGSKLVKRDFDDAETTIKRINFYRTNIEPIMLNLKMLYPFHFFSTECPIEECYCSYKKLMDELS